VKRRQSPSSDQIATASNAPMPYLGIHQDATAGLALTEALKVRLQRLGQHLDGVDHRVADADALPSRPRYETIRRKPQD
jgi:hypothetical protein